MVLLLVVIPVRVLAVDAPRLRVCAGRDARDAVHQVRHDAAPIKKRLGTLTRRHRVCPAVREFDLRPVRRLLRHRRVRGWDDASEGCEGVRS